MPRAQVLTLCVGADTFTEVVGDNAAYILGVSPWHQSLTATDEVTGWTATEFYERFAMFSGGTATYHAASAAAALNTVVLAMEVRSVFTQRGKTRADGLFPFVPTACKHD